MTDKNNKIKRGYKELETIVHTDQGSVYSSVSFNNIFKSYILILSKKILKEKKYISL